MKTFLLLILALALAGTLPAQEFNGGIHAGFDIASERDTWPNRLGLYTGIFTNRYVSERSSLQLELNYVQKGNRNRIDIDNADDYKLRLHYLELQFLYHYEIKRFTLETGPSLGWLVAYNEELNGNKIDDNPFEPIDLSIGIGLFYQLNENLRCGARYSNSLIPVRDGETIPIWPFFLGDFNEVLNFSLYWTFLHFRK
ncbi:MAG TPA: porin family protein [Bacteroidales bacterium]|nr:porin family protein [Bacteroidales bacterium]HRZ21171.1 porin family protein [Bacteroidales bacterium]